MSDDEQLKKDVDNVFGNEFGYQPKFGGTGGDIYLKFNDWSEREETAKIRIVTPTHTRLEIRKDDEIVNTKNWDISDFKAAIEDPDYKKTQRFSWVVLVRRDGKDPEAKVYEAGAGVFKKIATIAQDPDWTPITEVDLKITRRGVKKDARYEIVPSPNNRGAISDDEFAIADEVQLTKYLPNSMPLKKFIEVFGE